MPARSMASRPGSRSPSYHASPSPISSSAIWAIGARSPLAPTDPFWHTTGVTPRLSSSTSVSVISGRQPELPRAWTLMRLAIAARTYSIGRRVADTGGVVVDQVALELLDLLVGEGDLARTRRCRC